MPTDTKALWIIFWLSNRTVFQAPLQYRAEAVYFIRSLLGCELTAPEPSRNQIDINARSEIPEAMLHPQVMDANLSEQLETLEAVGTTEDVRQLKLQRLMHLVYTAPSRPTWEDPCLRPPPPGMYC